MLVWDNVPLQSSVPVPGPRGDPSLDPQTASLSMASTVDDLLACRGFGEAVEEWDLRSQQSDGPPANEDEVRDTKEHDDQKDQGSEPAEQQRPQQLLPAQHQHHRQAQQQQHEIVQGTNRHTESALQDSDRGHTASAETGQGSKETPIAGTVTRAWLPRAQLRVDHQGKQNPHSEHLQKNPDQQGVPQHLHTGWQALGVAAFGATGKLVPGTPPKTGLPGTPPLHRGIAGPKQLEGFGGGCNKMSPLGCKKETVGG